MGQWVVAVVHVYSTGLYGHDELLQKNIWPLQFSKCKVLDEKLCIIKGIWYSLNTPIALNDKYKVSLMCIEILKPSSKLL
jgi:hypothetical protein